MDNVRQILEQEAEQAEEDAQKNREEIKDLEKEIAEYTARAEEREKFAAECREALERIAQ